MAGRIRTLKPEWLEDELLSGMADSDRLLSVALILLADDHGLGRASPVSLAALVWGNDLSGDPHETLRKASGGLERLAAIGFITLYTVRKQQYYAVRNWKKHQKVSHPSKPRVPTPDECDPDPPPDSGPPSGDPPETLARSSALISDPDPDPDPDRRPTRARAAEPPLASGSGQASTAPAGARASGGDVIPIRPPSEPLRLRAPVDVAEGAKKLRMHLSAAWEELRGVPLNGEWQPIRDTAVWLWQVVEGDAIAFDELSLALVRRWMADPWVLENRLRLRNPAGNFAKAAQGLLNAEQGADSGEPLVDPRIAIQAELRELEIRRAEILNLPREQYDEAEAELERDFADLRRRSRALDEGKAS